MWEMSWNLILTVDDIYTLFKRCLNIRCLRLPGVPSERNAESIAKAIARTCDALRHLEFDTLGYKVNNQFPFAIIEALPEQQV